MIKMFSSPYGEKVLELIMSSFDELNIRNSFRPLTGKRF